MVYYQTHGWTQTYRVCTKRGISTSLKTLDLSHLHHLLARLPCTTSEQHLRWPFLRCRRPAHIEQAPVQPTRHWAIADHFQRTSENVLIIRRVFRPRRICDIYDLFAPCINLLIYLLTYLLTIVVSKLLKHINCRNLLDHLEKNNILTSLNHGFQSGYSCETQLLLTSNDRLKSYEAGTQVDIGILDFPKAFDTVPHDKLPYKLDRYGIKGSLHAWLTSFVTRRHMRVVLEGYHQRRLQSSQAFHKVLCLAGL